MTATTCIRCNEPFDPDDKRWDGKGQHNDNPWCSRCLDWCHDSEDAFHRCVIDQHMDDQWKGQSA